MATIDKAALIEAAAKAIFDVRDDEFDLDEWEDCRDPERWQCNAEAVVPVVVAAVLKPLRAQVAEWRGFMRDELELTDYERSALRLCASELERMLDQIEADAKGDER